MPHWVSGPLFLTLIYSGFHRGGEGGGRIGERNKKIQISNYKQVMVLKSLA